jgi:hypothetical protein
MDGSHSLLMVEAGNEAIADRVAAGHKHDRYGRRLSLTDLPDPLLETDDLKRAITAYETLARR